MEWVSQLEAIAHSSPALALVMAFAGGVLAAFTPCTYPMMPITVAFIGGKAQGSKRKGFILSVFYVFGMSIVYSSLGIFAALTGQLFGTISASPWTQLVMGNICLFFGLVMLEAVPLSPPAFLNRWKVSELRGHDILTSIILGGASALVVSTCTTPVLGVLLAFVASKHQIVLGAGMLFAFSYGLGSLVIVVGTFTGLLTSLPRSGIWMLRVQRIFGVLMILAAEYFLIKTGEFLL